MKDLRPTHCLMNVFVIQQTNYVNGNGLMNLFYSNRQVDPHNEYRSMFMQALRGTRQPYPMNYVSMVSSSEFALLETGFLNRLGVGAKAAASASIAPGSDNPPA